MNQPASTVPFSVPLVFGFPMAEGEIADKDYEPCEQNCSRD
jgi:hypothetical protein